MSYTWFNNCWTLNGFLVHLPSEFFWLWVAILVMLLSSVHFRCVMAKNCASNINAIPTRPLSHVCREWRVTDVHYHILEAWPVRDLILISCSVVPISCTWIVVIIRKDRIYSHQILTNFLMEIFCEYRHTMSPVLDISQVLVILEMFLHYFTLG